MNVKINVIGVFNSIPFISQLTGLSFLLCRFHFFISFRIIDKEYEIDELYEFVDSLEDYTKDNGYKLKDLYSQLDKFI